jgi:hypothetical protein
LKDYNKKKTQLLQNGYEDTGCENNYKINLPISCPFLNSRDETGHNDINFHCDLHNDVVLHRVVISYELYRGIFPTISYLVSEDNIYFQGP